MFLGRQVRPIAWVVFLALLAAPIIGFSHAAIPHGHTHTSDTALHVAIEHGLDSSLSRKDIVLPVLVVLFFSLVYAIHARLHVRIASSHEEPLLQALRRGVLPHRRFG